MIYLTRREHFNAAHKVFNPAWSKEKNQEIFGKCANENFHGHNYTLWVTVKGVPNPDSGYIVDLKQLSILINTVVIEPLDHKNINIDVPFMTGKMASTEMLAMAIWEQLEKPIADLGTTLHCIKLAETDNNSVEYFGGK